MPNLDREFRAIDTLLRKQPDPGMFRVTFGENQIEIFRRYPFDVNDMLRTFGIGTSGPPRSGSVLLYRIMVVDETERRFVIEQTTDTGWESVGEAVGLSSLVRLVQSLLKQE